MNIVKCENGHYYDEDKYELCPHCLNGLKKIRRDSIPTDVEMVIKGGFAEFVPADQLNTAQPVANPEDNARRVEIEQHYGQAAPDTEVTVALDQPGQQRNGLTNEEETTVLYDFGGK